MKLITTTVFLWIMVAACHAQDAKLRQQVVGSWADVDCGQLIVKTSISADGKFRTTCKNRKAPDEVMYYDGKWSVSNAMLVSTVTNITGASVTTTNDSGEKVSAKIPVGTTDHYKIVKASANELTLSKDGQATSMTRIK